MKLSFFGAARAVTGSNFLLEAAGKRILIDCGLFQGSWFAAEENEKFQYDPASIDAVLITHAHADHAGRLPKLVHEGFEGKIYATRPTKDLAKLILMDSVKIMGYDQREFGAPPLFSEADVAVTMRAFREIGYQRKREIFPGIVVEYFDAGHILGSAFIVVEAEGKRIAFSGDLGNSPTPLLPDLARLPEVDYAVCETTYGNRVHEDRVSRTKLLREAITDVVGRKGVLMIPVFAMERTQEILFELNDMVENKDVPSVPIFLDSPLAIDMTGVYKKYASFYNNDARRQVEGGDDIFAFPRLTFTRSKDESRQINGMAAPKVILAGSGFGTGGRILHHEKRYLGDPKSCVLMVSWQIPGSLGRALKDGEKKVVIHDEPIKVRAEIRAIGGYSAHADMPGLISFLRPAQKSLKKVFLVHGEDDQQKAFRRQLDTDLHVPAAIPKFKQSFEL